MKTAKIEVFKAGMYGQDEARIWSQEEVQDIIDNYEPDYRSAPVILGHNGWDGEEKPAYGWATGFSLNDNNILIADIEYNDDLGELVKNKMYSRVSMELTKKIEMYDMIGGKTGPYALAIALLGSNQPAVSGLEPISFSVEDKKFGVSIEFESKSENFKIDEESIEITGGTMPLTEEQIAELLDKATKFDASQTKLTAIEAENAKFKKELKDKDTENFMTANASKIVPAIKDQVSAFLNATDGEIQENFKKIISAMPENEIFKKLDENLNEHKQVDTDEKFSSQASKDLQATKG